MTQVTGQRFEAGPACSKCVHATMKTSCMAKGPLCCTATAPTNTQQLHFASTRRGGAGPAGRSRTGGGPKAAVPAAHGGRQGFTLPVD